jgi:hypothetical protein
MKASGGPPDDLRSAGNGRTTVLHHLANNKLGRAFSPESSTSRGNFACTSQAEGTTAIMATTNANLIWKIADLLRGRISPTSSAM